MKAVSNSSVLIALSVIDQLTLLERRFPEGVIVPEAVWREVVEQGAGRAGAQEVAAAAWLTVHKVRDTDFVNLLRGDLDEGEAAAIA